MRKNKRDESQKTNIVDVKSMMTSITCLICIALSFIFDKIVINVVDAIQYPLMFEFFYTITLLGETYIFFWIALFIIVAMMIRKRPFIAFILSLLCTAVLELALKSIINRPRPFEAMGIDSQVITSFSSFPSGHTMIFFAIIPILSKNFPKTKTIIWAIAILVGLSRIYLGVHYLSDVVAGAVMGYGVGWMFMKIGERYDWKY